MSLIGETLNNRFYILKSLAQDGLGHTYLAEDRGFPAHHHCVVKQLDPGKENLPDLDKIKELFDREADTLAKISLDSNNLIPKLIDRFEQSGALYLVQEFIDGAPLSAELTPGKKLTQIATLELLTQILTPLEYCHREKLIHRDLKPDNIMRRQNGELVPIDFGIAKHSYSGTPGYAPEEQQYGQPELASDIYAVGKIAIQAMTGLPPTQLRRNPDTMTWEWRQHCHVTDGFAAILDRMVELLAARRYQNAAEALAAVESMPRGGNMLLSPSTPLAAQPAVVVERSRNHHPLVEQSQNPPPPELTRQKFSFETAKLEIVTTQAGIFGFGKEVSANIVRRSGSAEYITEDLGDVKLELVYIPAGSCMMGSNEQDCEQPIHRVDLSAFYMGKYAITQEQYEVVMGKNPSRFKESNRPVESVSWDDGMEFCDRLSQLTGHKYSLPSESQWEYACRGGTTTPFCFGETISTNLVNYDGNYVYNQGLKGKYREQTTPVGYFWPNPFGLYDMHGNVLEWCLDTWHENYHGAPTDGSAWIEHDNDCRSLRGGSCDDLPDNCRSSARSGEPPNYGDSEFGFRVVCAPSPEFD
jgi:eukaryotic-like serine/threonine-protein kinase